MPCVLVTGANGFLAVHLLKQLVEKSFDVIGTVRTDAKAEEVIAAHPEFKDVVKFVCVPHMSARHAYKNIMEETEIDYIVHTAAPVPDSGGTDFDRDFLIPAVQGNIELLESARLYSKTVKHITVTGSTTSVHNAAEPSKGETLTSNDWNPIEASIAREVQNPRLSYAVSKTLADKAIWEYIEKVKPSFTVSVLLAPLIFGPPIQYLEKDALTTGRANMTTDIFYSLFLNKNAAAKDLTIAMGAAFYTAFIDVRDLAALHIRCFQISSEIWARSGRLLLAAPEPFLPENVLRILQQKLPDAQERFTSVPAASIGVDGSRQLLKLDDSEARQIFGDGIYRPLEQTVVDTARRLMHLEYSVSKQDT
ncbi:hypothetical protein V8C43DRAFT_320454 [Trichoderma afarasin]